MSNEAPWAAEAGAAAEASLEEHPFFSILQQVVEILADGFDHPDVWQALSGIPVDELVELARLIGALRPIQSEPPVLRCFDLLSGLIETITGDRSAGIAMLQQMEVEYSLCPQVAGAIFFATRWGDPSKSADLSRKFCESPFIKFETLIDGTVAPCCSIWTQQRLGALDRQSFEEIWNSPDAQAMRESILDGSYRYCNKQRCTYIMEDALPDRDSIDDPALRSIIDGGKTVLDSKPKWLFLAHDLTCNLACPSCRSELMGADEAQERRFEIIERDVFRPLLKNDDELIVSLSGQGDPWSSQHYRSILRYMADNELNPRLRLRLNTNALLMTEKRWADHAGLERYSPSVDVSIDACSPWVYEAVRRPGKWEKLYPNLEFISAKRAAGVFTDFRLNATVQLDNFHELGGLIELGEQLGADSVRLYMMQNTGGHLAPHYARKNIGDNAHPLHLAFLETLRDPRLGRSSAHLYDVATWRARAFEVALPSDSLGDGFGREALLDAIDAAIGAAEFGTVAALCAAGRVRLGDDPILLQIEARALQELGFAGQAEYRLKDAERLAAA